MQKRICICTTLWSSINNWIVHFLNDYHKRGVDVTIVCNMDEAFEVGRKYHLQENITRDLIHDFETLCEERIK